MSSYYLQLLEKQGKLSKEIIANYPVTYDPVRRKPRKSAFDKDGRRICCVCDTPKDPDQYTTKRSSVDGKDPRCNTCKVKLMTERNHARR